MIKTILQIYPHINNPPEFLAPPTIKTEKFSPIGQRKVINWFRMYYKNLWRIDADEEAQEFFQIALMPINSNVEYPGFVNAEKTLNEFRVAGSVANLILLDLNIPAKNGEQFLLRIKNYIKAFGPP